MDEILETKTVGNLFSKESTRNNLKGVRRAFSKGYKNGMLGIRFIQNIEAGGGGGGGGDGRDSCAVIKLVSQSVSVCLSDHPAQV